LYAFYLGNSPASEFYVPTFRNTLFYLHGRVGVCSTRTSPPTNMEQCSETSAYKIQTPGNLPRKKAYNIQNTAKVWKSRKTKLLRCKTCICVVQDCLFNRTLE